MRATPNYSLSQAGCRRRNEKFGGSATSTPPVGRKVRAMIAAQAPFFLFCSDVCGVWSLYLKLPYDGARSMNDAPSMGLELARCRSLLRAGGEGGGIFLNVGFIMLMPEH